MTKKPTTEAPDQALFMAAMRGVKRLKHTKMNELPTRPKPQRIKQPPDIEEECPLFFSDYDKIDPITSETMLHFARSGISHKILRKLRQGQYNVEARLDMHGMNVSQAKEALSRFLTACQEEQIRHVLIIHGKGRSNTQPILKNKLNNWLRQTEQVLAYSSATAKDGRSGALYVLLRRTQ